MEPTAVPAVVPAAPLASPTASLSFDPLCFATEAYALEFLVTVIGPDEVPTAFDSVNQSGYEFQFSVDRITIEPSGVDAT